MNIEQLNIDHGITGQLKFVEGAGGLSFIKIDNEKASAVISVYAGQVLSYQPANDSHNLMFLSEAAYYQPGKAIKGGVPICWPWFGPDPDGLGRPAHGFVRNRFWNVIETETKANGDTAVTLGLTDTSETRAIWPHSFSLALKITIGESLNLELSTRNTDVQPFFITQAFHTYFKIGRIDQVAVLGLDGLEYIDKADNAVHRLQAGVVTIHAEVDRIYHKLESELVIDDLALDRRIRITSAGSNTAVVWNPWAEISAEMGDLKDNDYEHFLCVETANADQEVVKIAPGEEFRLAANYRIESDFSHVLKSIQPLSVSQ